MPSRRGVLASCAAAMATIPLAGCIGDLGGDDTDDAAVPDIPRVSDPPNAVYVPTHRESMAHLPAIHDGDIAISPMLTYPHRFWTVTGTTVEEVEPSDQRGVHLMFTVWDPVTDHVLPVEGGAEVTLERDGEHVETMTPWPMISQTMGFHFGDNVALPDDGEYTVTVDVPPMQTSRTGEFADRFQESASVSFSFVYDAALRASLIEQVDYLEEDLWGERGALEPMDHPDPVDIEAHVHNGGHEDGHGDDGDGEHGGHDGHDDHMPFSQLPDAESYGGADLGTAESGDATFVMRYLADSDIANDGYFMVSPRTPYNRVPLADMALSVDGATSGTLEQQLDPERGLHYGIETELSSGDTLTITTDAPPQVSRHNGYETAFLDMDPIEVHMPE